jgi:hypothetical protein
VDIPLVKHFETSEKLIEVEKSGLVNKKFILSEIKDHSKGEVISATRFSAFSNCPLKYNLLYNNKLGDLIQQSNKYQTKLRQNFLEEYNRNELDSYLLDDHSGLAEFSKLKGELTHYALRKNISKDSLPAFIENWLQNNFSEEIPESLNKSLLTDLQLFYASIEFKFINSFTNYKNEYEAYLTESDYYLFGILDRLIIDEKKIIIVDYKTDNIKETELNSRAEKYLPQLKFYAYIISRLFIKKYEIEGRIIFVKYPEKPYVFNYDDISDRNIKADIDTMIFSIRNNNYSVNLNACKECIFSDEKSQCIKLKSAVN